MARFIVYIAVSLLTFSFGLLSWFINPFRSSVPPLRDAVMSGSVAYLSSCPHRRRLTTCADDAFKIKPQGNAPARLTVIGESCAGSDWYARLSLENTSDRTIRGYEIGDRETYDSRRGLEASHVDGGMNLAPGESRQIWTGGGFNDGMSYSRPAGAMRETNFWIKRIEFADGTVWVEKNPSE